MMKCVTGSTGFLGAALSRRLLKENYKILAITRKHKVQYNNFHENLKIVETGDNNLGFNWYQVLNKVDCLIHCAAKTHEANKIKKSADKLSIYRKINVDLTRNLAEQAASIGVKRFIFLSSIKVNGERTVGISSFKHNDICNPEDAYGISKWEAEQALLEVSKQTGLEVIIIRAPLIYGEGVKANFLRLLDLVYNTIPLPFANINNLRSFVGLDNLIDLIIRCIDHPKAPGEIFLVSDGEDISTPNLIKKLSQIMNKSTRLFSMPVSLMKVVSSLIDKSSEIDKLIGSLRIDNSHAHEILKWSPPYSLNEGLEKTINWYLKNK